LELYTKKGIGAKILWSKDIQNLSGKYNVYPPIISKTLAVSAFTAFLSLAAAPAQALLISGITISSTLPTFGGTPNNIVNGVGLPGNVPSLTASHNVPDGSNAWAFVGTTGNIDFNLNGLYDLDGFSFWNANNSSNTSSINGVNILTSLNGVNYTPLPGAPTQFAIGVNSLSPQPPQQFAFTATQASFVRFTVLSNYGFSGATSFAEVQFSSATPVPFEFSPALGIGALGGAWFVRKQLKKKATKG
jgi:hypothetical protein